MRNPYWLNDPLRGYPAIDKADLVSRVRPTPCVIEWEHRTVRGWWAHDRNDLGEGHSALCHFWFGVAPFLDDFVAVAESVVLEFQVMVAATRLKAIVCKVAPFNRSEQMLDLLRGHSDLDSFIAFLLIYRSGAPGQCGDKHKQDQTPHLSRFRCYNP